jgi:hypothetical protein
VIADIKGKGNENTVTSLLDLKDILKFCYDFGVVSLAFDGDSCFDGLQENMFTDLSKQIDAEGPGLPNVRTDHLVNGDPLHIEKRIRYQWVCSTFRIGYGSEENISFFLERIQMTQILSPTVFSNAAYRKMHDSFSLRLFSPVTPAIIFKYELGSDVVIALITIVRTSDDSLALDCIGSSPLERAFGNMRICCRDVHTLEKMITAFLSIELTSVVPSLLNLQQIPRRPYRWESVANHSSTENIRSSP